MHFTLTQLTESCPLGVCRLMAMLILLLAGSAGANPSVLVVYDAESASHRAIFDQLNDAVFADNDGGARVRVEGLAIGEAPEDAPLSTQVELIITVGVRAAARVSRQPNDTPVLNVFLPRAAYLQLSAATTHKPAAIFLDQPIERQLALARALLPDARLAGMLSGPGNASNVTATAHKARTLGLDMDIVEVGLDDDPAKAIQRVLAENDVVIATFDREVYKPATAKWLLYLAFRRQRPIVGFSYALLKAGAVAAVFSTPEQVAAHATDLVEDWLRTGRSPAGTFSPRYYHIGLNAPVARKLGLRTPSDEALAHEVRSLLGDEQ